MYKKIGILIAILLFSGGMMFGIGSIMSKGATESFDKDKSIVEQIDSNNSNMNSQIPSEVKQEEFTNINISVAAADIYLRTGNEFSIKYNLDDKETVTTSEITDKTLKFHTNSTYKFIPDDNDLNVIVTIPRETKLENVILKTISGDINIELGIDLENAELNTVSGEIEVNGVSAEKIKAETISGEISFENSDIIEVSAENKSEDIDFYGNFDSIYAYSISGSIEMSGTVSQCAEIETVSGEISSDVIGVSYEAKSHGGVSYMGLSKGSEFQTNDGEPIIKLNSVSGEIEILDD